jgi:hypothetical protein
MAVELGPHQLRAIEEMHNGSVLRGGVGTGKSRTALAYFLLKECGAKIRINGRGDTKWPTSPKDLFIITTGKKRDSLDWFGEAAPFGLGKSAEDSFGNIRVTVDSWNNIGKYKDVKNAFFIFDEQRLVGSGAWVKAFIKIAQHNNWIMLSATPGDTWMDFIPVFVANGFYKNRTEFVRTHVVWNNYAKFPKIDHYVEVRRLVKYRNQIIVEMPYERLTVRHTKIVPVDYDHEKWNRVVKDRWHIYEDRPIKDVSELFQVMRKLVNTDPSRSGALMKIVEKHPKLIVFYTFNYELDILRVLCQTLNYPYSEWNGQKHEEIRLQENKWIYLVQYTSGSESWNCIETDSMVFWSLSYSYKITEQSKGRIDRINTLYTDLYYYMLRSAAPIDMAIAKSLVLKKNFNEKEFVF